jgi:hypothetical protein
MNFFRWRKTFRFAKMRKRQLFKNITAVTESIFEETATR